MRCLIVFIYSIIIIVFAAFVCIEVLAEVLAPRLGSTEITGAAPRNSEIPHHDAYCGLRKAFHAKTMSSVRSVGNNCT